MVLKVTATRPKANRAARINTAVRPSASRLSSLFTQAESSCTWAILGRAFSSGSSLSSSAALQSNPLPDAFVLETGGSAAELERLEPELKALPKIAHVQLDSAWVKRLESLLALGRTAVLILATLLASGLVAVTFNTIRLQILTQKDEIEVSKLIGATDAFIRRPFFHLGLIQGALGGLAALAIVYLCMLILNRSILELAQLYGSDFRLGFFGFPDCLALLAFAAVLGWLGAYMSVSRHLANIEPR